MTCYYCGAYHQPLTGKEKYEAMVEMLLLGWVTVKFSDGSEPEDGRWQAPGEENPYGTFYHAYMHYKLGHDPGSA